MYVSGGWHNFDRIFNESNAYKWGQYIGNRYPGLPKILGGDSNALWSWNMSAVQNAYNENPDQDLVSMLAPVEDTSSVWSSMRRGLKDSESQHGYDSLVIYHPTNMWIVKPEVSGHATPDPTNTFSPAIGWDSTKNYECIAEMRDKFTGPVIDLENHYEGAHDSFDLDKVIGNASHIRTGLYHGVYSGASGFTYGANSVWQMYEPRTALLRDSDWFPAQINQNESGSWREDIYFEDATQAKYVTKPLSGLSTAVLESLEPARELLSSPSNHTGKSVNTYEARVTFPSWLQRFAIASTSTLDTVTRSLSILGTVRVVVALEALHGSLLGMVSTTRVRPWMSLRTTPALTSTLQLPVASTTTGCWYWSFKLASLRG
ncbi:hypothetical protein L914_07342 [Phytophthora nicotianae]|uniref:Apiosidase-like catalytic domain-containing protein n=1 Tax=Phytophthora nicotianae TaxID=4792 RepID=W2NJE6_PHYNI|nr:hypothetical protein L914_07342 [Phytophthora nicotianae]